jgi:peptide-methionine (R)-S-oxide reductase
MEWPFWLRGIVSFMTKVNKTDEQWRENLSDEQYRVLRKKGTEPPFTGTFVYEEGRGMFICAGCGSRLFSSETKFDANCGWPSFYDALPGSVVFNTDYSHGMVRTEVACSNCGGHLGHVFNDAPSQPSGQRYCINSVSLDFLKEK